MRIFSAQFSGLMESNDTTRLSVNPIKDLIETPISFYGNEKNINFLN